MMESLIRLSMFRSAHSVQSHAGPKLSLHPLLSILKHTFSSQSGTEAWIICSSLLVHLERMSNLYTHQRPADKTVLTHDLLQGAAGLLASPRT